MTDEKKFKIIIVDDDDIVRETYHQVFSEHGFEATEAKDGVEGIDLISKGSFDVIMTGIIMPRMDGFQLISALRENIDTKDVPIAIISHLGREEDRKRAKELDIDAFIVQGSMTPREVVNRVKNLISASSSFQIGFDYFGWSAPALAKKMGLPGFECPNCHSKIILELTPKIEGKGLDASFRCPKCDLNL
ncbi:MAG: response regulator [Candidatus Moraniibacteriota bacterium]